MNERIEKFKFRRQLRQIDWDSVIKAVLREFKAKEDSK